jgi:hypothetical protein
MEEIHGDGPYDQLGLPISGIIFKEGDRLPDGSLVLQPTNEKETVWIPENSIRVRLGRDLVKRGRDGADVAAHPFEHVAHHGSKPISYFQPPRNPSFKDRAKAPERPSEEGSCDLARYLRQSRFRQTGESLSSAIAARPEVGLTVSANTLNPKPTVLGRMNQPKLG